VAYGQLDWKIRQDNRVVVLERFNARKIQPCDVGHQLIDLAVMDTSFISITKILPALLPLFASQAGIMALIKPQFELSREKVGKGGVVRQPELHQEAIEHVSHFIASIGLKSHGVVKSPILGPKGNTEFLIYMTI
jgi:23S rRNA (cytidine1920-2'-O)/16S rRNA (cytidine1409-2'-O)-methyltransferase